ncbi:CCHC-type domain-containing protein [Trichonephila clavipes]|nr:CCHC-type domain-containing protein [Trichonephila clavipes]
MAFLGKGLKVDLQVMATEMAVEDVLGLKVVELRVAFLNSKSFDEFCREFLDTIIEEKKGRDRIGREEKKRRDGIDGKEEAGRGRRERRRDEMDFELQKKPIELKERNENEVKEPGQIKINLYKLIPKFDPKSDDISLFLKSFERQAKFLNLPKICWVTHLISILPLGIVGLIAREPEKDAADYKFVKKLLLQRFKLSPEKFRQLFVKHQKNPDGTWKDFYYEIRNFCEEWLNT